MTQRLRTALRLGNVANVFGLLIFVSFASIASRPASAQVCGNGILEAGEACDDGNTVPLDGCDHLCETEPTVKPWPDGVVYFEFDSSVSTGNGDTEYFRRGMDAWSQTDVDVVFLPRNGLADVPYVIISNVSSEGNKASAGAPARVSGVVTNGTLNLNNTGMNGFWFPVHEFGHTLGFEHEQKRDDRDLYLTINFQNIEGGIGNDNYDPKLSTMIYDQNMYPFSYDSIMLYDQCFSIVSTCDCPDDPNCVDGGVNMTATDSSKQETMGTQTFADNNDRLYQVDIDRAISVYGVGHVRYVNVNSNDASEGTLEKPYTSFNAANNNAPNGARVFFNGGNYDLGPRTITKQMTMRAYPNSPATFR